MIRTIVVISICLTLRSQPNPVKEGEKHIREFTKVDFEYQIFGSEPQEWLVLFHSPNCGHCVKFKPTYSKMAYDNLEWKTKFAEVNCKEQDALCKMIRIKAYPTLIFFKDKLMYKFESQRNEEAINAFIRDGYKSVKGLDIPDKPPTFMEEIKAVLGEMYSEISHIYSNGHWVLKACISVFLFVVGGLVLTTMYFIYDIFTTKKVPRTIPKPKND